MSDYVLKTYHTNNKHNLNLFLSQIEPDDLIDIKHSSGTYSYSEKELTIEYSFLVIYKKLKEV